MKEKYLLRITMKRSLSSPQIFWKLIVICNLRWLDSRPGNYATIRQINHINLYVEYADDVFKMSSIIGTITENLKMKFIKYYFPEVLKRGVCNQ